jgi:peroxin-3
MDQGVRELEAFAAVVYSSNFESELLRSGTKMEPLGEDTPGSDTVLIEEEDYEDYDHARARKPSTAAPGEHSAYETAWGKAVEGQPSSAA